MNQQRQGTPATINLSRSHSIGVSAMLSSMKMHPWYLNRLYHERGADIEQMTHCDVVDNKDLEIGARLASDMIIGSSSTPDIQRSIFDVSQRFATINNISDVTIWHKRRIAACIEYKTTKRNIWDEGAAFTIVTEFIRQKPEYLDKYNLMCGFDWVLYVIADSRGDEMFSLNQQADIMKSLWGRQVAYEIRRPDTKKGNFYGKSTMGELCSFILPDLMTDMQAYLSQRPQARDVIMVNTATRFGEDRVFKLDEPLTINSKQLSLAYELEQQAKSSEQSAVLNTGGMQDSDLDDAAEVDDNHDLDDAAEVDDDHGTDDAVEVDDDQADKHPVYTLNHVISIASEKIKSLASEDDPDGLMCFLSRIDGAFEMYELLKGLSNKEALEVFLTLSESDQLSDSPIAHHRIVPFMEHQAARAVAAVHIVASDLCKKGVLEFQWKKNMFADLVYDEYGRSINVITRIVNGLRKDRANRLRANRVNRLRRSKAIEKAINRDNGSAFSRRFDDILSKSTKLVNSIGEDVILSRFPSDIRTAYNSIKALSMTEQDDDQKIKSIIDHLGIAAQQRNMKSSHLHLCVNSSVFLLALAIYRGGSNSRKSAVSISAMLTEFFVREGKRSFNMMAVLVGKIVTR